MAIDSVTPRSRRSLLLGAVGAVAGAAAATLSGAQRVLAAADDGKNVTVGANFTQVGVTTKLINNSNKEPVLRVGSNQGGAGIEAFSWAGAAVDGQSSNTGVGVRAQSSGGIGVHATHGIAAVSTAYPAAVLAEVKKSNGLAVLGNNYATSGHAQGVQGTSDSPKGFASTGWSRNGGTGVIGVSGHSQTSFPSVPAETGGYFKATKGRGVVASGTKAQLRLVPSTASSHPSSGSAGDLFLDKSKRLWLCTGGTSWKRLG